MDQAVVQKYLSPLLVKDLFTSEEEAMRELVLSYISRKVAELSIGVESLEEKYQMNYLQFQSFIQKEIQFSKKATLEEKKNLSKSIMAHEDDLLEWKAKREILESWLELREGID